MLTGDRPFFLKATPRLEWAKRHTAAGVGRMTDLALVQGKGSFVLSDQNEVFLDFATGIGTCILGHAHPRVAEAVAKQASLISHAQVNISFHNKQLDLVERLIGVMPKGLDRIFFWNGGADAIEAAWKLARHATGKKNIIVMQGEWLGVVGRSVLSRVLLFPPRPLKDRTTGAHLPPWA